MHKLSLYIVTAYKYRIASKYMYKPYNSWGRRNGAIITDWLFAISVTAIRSRDHIRISLGNICLSVYEIMQCKRGIVARVWWVGVFYLSGNNNGGRRDRQHLKLEPVDPNHKRPDKRDLVYFDESPNFCDKNEVVGFPGTTGRECNASSIGIDGCDLLCCGRGYVSESYTVRERCSCTFIWCCEVKCKVCTRTKIRHTCLWRHSVVASGLWKTDRVYTSNKIIACTCVVIRLLQ